MRHAGYVLSRTQLLEQAWEYDFEHRSNVVEVYVRYLRRKVDVPFGRKSIETVRGAGYRLRKDGGRSSRLSIRLRLTLVFAAVDRPGAGAAPASSSISSSSTRRTPPSTRGCARAPTNSRRRSAGPTPR